MRPTSARSLQAVAGLLFFDYAVGQALTTYNPCPQNSTVKPVPVTAQYQPVSTCFPSTQCASAGNCSTSYSYKTYDYVSTVIPCAYDGATASTCTVTATDEVVVLSTATTTLTSVTTVGPRGRFRRPQVSTITESRDHRVEAAYNAIGPIGIPGYAGSGLCNACENPSGVLEQAVVITECRLKSGQQQPECQRKEETRVQLPPKMQAAPATAVVSSRFKAPSAGVYTFSFEQTAPPRTVTAEARTITVYVHGRPTAQWQPERTITVPAQPWHAVVTKTCTGPTVIDFTTTMTTTVTVTSPIVISPQP